MDWYWLGGRPSLDLVNTRRERWRRDYETLHDSDDVVRWMVATGLLEAEMVPRPGLVDETRRLREAVNGAVVAVIEGSAVDPAAITIVDDWLVHAGTRPQLVVAGDGLPALAERAPADSPRRALGMIALDAAEMLGSPEQRERIRICGADDCSARFYDRSPAGRRRWCSMERCGNVAKARRHREREREAGG